MSATPCGLERWSALVAPNFTMPVTTSPTVALANLTTGVTYKVNVVATCSELCLKTLYSRLGLPHPTGSLSAQRIAFVQTTFALPADPVPPVVVHEEPITAFVFTMMVLAMVGTVFATLVMGFRRGVSGADGFAFGGVDAAGRVHAKGPSGRTVLASLNSFFFSTRALRASGDAGDVGAALAAQGVKVVGEGAAAGTKELEELASVAGRVFGASERGLGSSADASSGGAASAGGAASVPIAPRGGAGSDGLSSRLKAEGGGSIDVSTVS